MPTRHAVEQCGIIVKACEQLAIACDNLKGMRGVQEALVQVKAFEDEGDRVLRDALAASSATRASTRSSSFAGRTSTKGSRKRSTPARPRRTSSGTSSSRAEVGAGVEDLTLVAVVIVALFFDFTNGFHDRRTRSRPAFRRAP